MSLSQVLRNALDQDDPNRCNFREGEKWLFLRNFTTSDANILTGVNAVSNAVLTPVLQPLTCNSDPHTCSHPTLSTSTDPSTLDHLRLRSSFSFHPQHSTYPFATQTLPILLEFPFSTTTKTDYDFCTLDRYTGFSPWLEKGQGGGKALTLSTTITR